MVTFSFDRTKTYNVILGVLFVGLLNFFPSQARAKIVFTAKNHGKSSIWSANENGTGKKKLLSKASAGVAPDYVTTSLRGGVSPDGKTVAGITDDQKLYLISSSTGEKRLAMTNVRDVTDWSNDSRYIVVTEVTNDGVRVTLWLIDVQTLSRQQIGTSTEFISPGSFSPNGEQVVFAKGWNDKETAKAYVFNRIDGTITDLALKNEQQTFFSGLIWGPSKLAYGICYEGSCASTTLLVNPDASNSTAVITKPRGLWLEPRQWSADGSCLLAEGGPSGDSGTVQSGVTWLINPFRAKAKMISKQYGFGISSDCQKVLLGVRRKHDLYDLVILGLRSKKKKTIAKSVANAYWNK